MNCTRIIILAASVKRQNYCVAGKKWHQNQDNIWLRPVGNSLPDGNDALTSKEIQYHSNRIPSTLDVVDIQFLRYANHNIQSENHLIDTAFKWDKKGTYPVEKLSEIVDNPETLWFVNREGTNSRMGINDCFPTQYLAGPTNSLYLILINELIIHLTHEEDFYGKNRKRYRGSFNYKGVNYKLSITDPNIYSQYGQSQDGDYNYGKCYATISMAPLEDNGNCYKFLAALFKFKV
ncbi:hypothetical protein HV213_19500 [Klebsiella sp. RHBSTW-00484]|uniref:dual OB domain-containing protein n=1 Tax=unclassified Klebsiella TaxID=2608929 RepID=UPI0015E58D1E|nr:MULTISPECIES: hypothetical protein [unclassified Klebsiella]MBA7846227.1 hypothetical protein [Klebsiella sp. RHBSTW-00465]QLO37857.1 hypothetical protein HV213_19500 [Klebsiella sp. RHBSTW-00484]QLT77376.1 hypothetical protein HV204_19500 [Klebsiella sp. RHBSTW-00464]HAT1558690.1 hypothetical protein [Raoultella ornithinolytica]